MFLDLVAATYLGFDYVQSRLCFQLYTRVSLSKCGTQFSFGHGSSSVIFVLHALLIKMYNVYRFSRFAIIFWNLGINAFGIPNVTAICIAVQSSWTSISAITNLVSW
jgi:hypothetical protein